MSKAFLKPKKALSFYVIPKQQNRGIYIPFCRLLIADFSNHLNFIGSINAKTYQALEAKTWGGRDYEQTEKKKRVEGFGWDEKEGEAFKPRANERERAEAWGVTVWHWIILISFFVLNFYAKIFFNSKKKKKLNKLFSN